MCNGHVYFASRVQYDYTTPATFMDILEQGYAIVDANNTGVVSCSSDMFEGADPSPDTAKQCFCDDKKTFTSHSELLTQQDYWRQETYLSTYETEITTAYETEVQYESYEESYYQDSYYYDDYGGGYDDSPNSCKLCKDDCKNNQQNTLQRELDK